MEHIGECLRYALDILRPLDSGQKLYGIQGIVQKVRIDPVSYTHLLLCTGGRFYLVHRPFRLAEIMTMLVSYRLEPKRMRLVYPFEMCIRDRCNRTK